jgi:hypothetical protein
MELRKRDSQKTQKHHHHNKCCTMMLLDILLLGDGSKHKRNVFIGIVILGLIACNVRLSTTAVLNMQLAPGFNNNIDTTTTFDATSSNPRGSLRQPDIMQQEERPLLQQQQPQELEDDQQQHLLPAQQQSVVEHQAPLPSSTQQQQRLEFVHIPKTGGRAIEDAALKRKIKWGANHYNRNRVPLQRRFLGVPYWHIPAHYYQRDNIDSKTAAATAADNIVPSAVLAEFDPYGPSPSSPLIRCLRCLLQ